MQCIASARYVTLYQNTLDKVSKVTALRLRHVRSVPTLRRHVVCFKLLLGYK